jgi:hypothetical protein
MWLPDASGRAESIPYAISALRPGGDAKLIAAVRLARDLPRAPLKDRCRPLVTIALGFGPSFHPPIRLDWTVQYHLENCTV